MTASALPFVAASAPFVVATVAWEVYLHRRTVQKTTAETRELRKEVDAWVKEAKADRDAMMQRLDKLTTMPQPPALPEPSLMANGEDAHDMSQRAVAAREKKALARAEGSAIVASLLGEFVPLAEQFAPDAVRFARDHPHLAERVLTPILARIRQRPESQQPSGGTWS